MWYTSIDQDQFRTYTKQEARIALAYWQSVRIDYLCENQSNQPLFKQKIGYYTRKSKQLLKEVITDLSNQEGITKELTQLDFEYTLDFLDSSFTNLEKRISCSKFGEEMTDDILAVEKEMEFLKQRIEITPGDSLLEEYDRGVYLLYECMLLADRANSHEHKIKSEIQHRLDSVLKVMRPSFIKTQKHCKNYIAHLGLETKQEHALINQYTVDLCGMFEAMFEAAKLTRITFKTARLLASEFSTEAEVHLWNDKINEASAITQNRLICVNMQRASNLLEALS